MLRDNVMIVMEQVNIVCYAMNLVYVINVRVVAFVINAMVMLVTHVLIVKAVKIVIYVVVADNTSFGQAVEKLCIWMIAMLVWAQAIVELVRVQANGLVIGVMVTAYALHVKATGNVPIVVATLIARRAITAMASAQNVKAKAIYG